MQDRDARNVKESPAEPQLRKPYRAPRLTCFGPVSLLTGVNMAGSAFDAKFGDNVGMTRSAADLPTSL